MAFSFPASGRLRRRKLRSKPPLTVLHPNYPFHVRELTSTTDLINQPFRRHEGAYRHAARRRRAIQEHLASKSAIQQESRQNSEEPAIKHPLPKTPPKAEKSIREFVRALTQDSNFEHEAVERLSEAAEGMIIHWFERKYLTTVGEKLS